MSDPDEVTQRQLLSINEAPIVVKSEPELFNKYNKKLIEFLNVKESKTKASTAKDWKTPHLILMFLENTIKSYMGVLVQDSET